MYFCREKELSFETWAAFFLQLKSCSIGLPQKVLQFLAKFMWALFSTRKIENRCRLLTCLLSVLIVTVNSSHRSTLGSQCHPMQNCALSIVSQNAPSPGPLTSRTAGPATLAVGGSERVAASIYGAWTAQVLALQSCPLFILITAP